MTSRQGTMILAVEAQLSPPRVPEGPGNSQIKCPQQPSVLRPSYWLGHGTGCFQDPFYLHSTLACSFTSRLSD